jgi:hypothetical protein
MANLPITPLPFPPDSYDQRYFNQMLRTLNLYFRQLQNPGAILGTTITLTNLPTSPTGLPAGAVWVDTAASNVLKVVV